MADILLEYDKKVVKRMCMTVLNSPQGRDLGRYFLIERGKGKEGDLGKVMDEVFTIMAECVRELYAAPVPSVSGQR